MAKLKAHQIEINCVECGISVVKDKGSNEISKTKDQCKYCSNVLSFMKTLDRKKLQEILHYDRNTGSLTLKRNQRVKYKGESVTYAHSQGYEAIRIGNKDYLAHRVIWFMETGIMPNQIDHINHNRSDNRWVNLREISARTNQLNMSKRQSKLGIQGVRKLPSGKFNAYIMVNRKQISLGSFIDVNDAISARKEAEKLYGFHPNHGN